MTLATAAFLWLMPWSFLAGNLMARADLARGKAQMMAPPSLNPWGVCHATALQQGSGTEMLSAALCRISSAEAHFEQGYNATVHHAMRDQAGRGQQDTGVRRAALDRQRPRQ